MWSDEVGGVVLESPEWPLASAANGIASYVSTMHTAFRSLAVPCAVITGRGKADAVQTGFPATRIDRALVSAASLISSPAAAAVFLGLSAMRALRGLPGHFNILEIEETFGCSLIPQFMSGLCTVVRMHGPWAFVAPKLGKSREGAFAHRTWLEGQAIRRAHGVTAPSRYVLDGVRSVYGLPLEHAVVIPNPAPSVPPPQRWDAFRATPGSVLFVGRFDHVKGPDVLLRAFAQALGSRPELRLTMVGPDQGLLDARGRKWHFPEWVSANLPPEVQDRIRFLGARTPDTVALLRAESEVTVVSSRFENFPVTLLEAMAHGCPVVAARVGGIPEMLSDGDTGLLFEPESAQDLCAKLIKLVDNRDLRIRLSSAASKAVEQRFGANRIARRTLDYYRECLRRMAKSGNRPAS